jgi:hypothetical protein
MNKIRMVAAVGAIAGGMLLGLGSASASTTTITFSPTADPSVAAFDTGVAVTSTTPVVATATGTIYLCFSGGCPSSPDGYFYDGGNLTVNSTTTAAGLYYRVGTSGAWTFLGSGPTTISGSGEIYLTTNDNPGAFWDNFGSFSVNFTPATPTAKSDCMNGGWVNYGTTFKNQGDCVSYITTGGKNAPAGS